MQNIMKNRPGHQERLAQKVLEAMPLVEFSWKLAELHLSRGRRFLLGRPADEQGLADEARAECDEYVAPGGDTCVCAWAS